MKKIKFTGTEDNAMKKIISHLLLCCLPLATFGQSSGAELIESSIRFHDPQARWSTTRLLLGFNDTRPGKADRQASFSFDNGTGTACVTREIDGHTITWHVLNDECQFDFDGRQPTANEAEEYRLTKERGLTMRNYYLYLWGLPMKLKDKGTIIDPEIYEKSFNGKLAKVAKVTYEEAIGSDIWYFYFDPLTFELVGYQFFHDEAKGDGEYIILSGLEKVDGMKIPKNRSWYTNPDSTLLGTDQLVHAYRKHGHD